MKLRVLIASPDKIWSKELIEYLGESDFNGEYVSNGKDAQLLLYKEKYYCVVLDADLTQHNAFEVLRYIKANSPLTPVILFFSSKESFKRLELTKKDLLKIGVSDVLINPVTNEGILHNIQGLSRSESWMKLKPSQELSDEEEVAESDSKFTQVALKELHMGSAAIFDLYVRVKKNHYIKIFKQGDFFDKNRIQKYREKGAHFLYFKTSDRMTFVNYMNQVINTIFNTSKINSS